MDLDIGLSMARLRAKGAHLCLWTRFAIGEWISAGATYRQVAEEFGVSVATVQRAVRKGGRGYDLLGCKRTLSSSQAENLKLTVSFSG
jgi:IS30 family transposase